jgi:thiol-disulfide isomerase/thioredoxin
MNTELHPLRGFILSFTVLIGLAPSLSKAQPANDLFANRIVITGTNVVVTGSSVGATREAGEPYHAGLVGGASVWWSWTAPSAGTLTMSTAGSSFDTVLGVYTGSLVSALTAVASDDDDPDSGALTSKVVFDVVPNQTYQIAVDGYGGAWGSVQLSVQLGPVLPPPPAPAWALPDPYGVTVYSTNYASKVVILDFWATWCSPCKAEMPDLVALQDKYRADGLVIVGADISWSGDSSQAVQTFVVTNTPPLNYQTVMSTSATEAAYGNVSGGAINAIPATFIIDRQNLIRRKYVGTQSRSTLEKQIIPLLYGNTCLGCKSSGSQMTFCWRANAQTFTLESALAPAGAWSAWPTTPTVVNGTNTVQVPTTNSARYFRLRMPC